MTSRRFRRGNHTAFIINAPKSLLNTSETAIGMNTAFAADLENLIPKKKRLLSKRKGLTNKLVSGTINGNLIAGRFISLSDGTYSGIAFTDTGFAYKFDSTFASFTLIRSGLDITGTYRFAYFNQKLIIVTGKDTNMIFDGTTLTDMQEYVVDAKAGFYTIVDTDTLTLQPEPSRQNSDYPVGSVIRLFIDGSSTPILGTILISTYNAGTNTVTLDLTTNILTGTTIDIIEYPTTPPPFSFIYAAHDRLWGLSGGELKATTHRTDNFTNNMAVYYTDAPNNENGWFNALTQEVAFINISDKHLINDELVGIALYQKRLVFFGRLNCQEWEGTDPTGVSSDVLRWSRTFPIGCVHGDLIQEINNDILFYTPYGVRQFSVVTLTNDIKSSQEKGSNISNIAIEQATRLLSTDTLYKSARSFRFARGGFFGFRLPSEVHIRVEEEDYNGWTRFTQLFHRCADYAVAPDGDLFMFKGSAIYKYEVSTETYSDDGSPIKTNWVTPFMQPRQGTTFAGRYFELITEAGETIPVDIARYTNNSTCFIKKEVIVSPLRNSFWDIAFWDISFWDCSDDNKLPTIEDKFIAETFAYSISSNTTTGSLDIVGLKIYGKIER